jgi:Flp pilus assembly pilin Flp
MLKLIKRFHRDQRGSNAIEYALVLAFVCVGFIGVLPSLNSNISGLIKGWGPAPSKTTSTAKPISNGTYGFQNLTAPEVKNLYTKFEQQDKMSGIGVQEWSSVYQSVTGKLPDKSSVLKTFDATDGSTKSGGNNDGVLSYAEFKNATFINSY